MKYSEFIKVDEKFQTSINLEYDINKIEKINSYIPTEQSVKILGTYLRSIYYDNKNQNRASILIGPYGRGKSHLLLILTALVSLDTYSDWVSSEEAAKTLQVLCEKISLVDAEIGALAHEIVNSKKRLLPIIVNSNTTDINQAFIIALKETLTKADLLNLLPDTYFDVAVSTVDRWRASFPDAYEKLSSELKKRKKTVEELYIALKQYDNSAYQIFCSCYPSIAAGSEFNPLINMDVVKLYVSVNNALCEQTNYKGLYIVFDEFSKFLETNLEKSKMLYFKIIQDMAEIANRSGKYQLHFTCVTHKEILDYSISDSFKTVEGRFKKVRFVASSEQSYELIANAIYKSEKFDEYKHKHKYEFANLVQQSYLTGAFSSLTEDAFEKKLVYGCFPMSPLSAYVLLRVSEKVAQNERTLFTFLAQDDANTLASFIRYDFTSMKLLTVEYIYNYFEELFKKEMFNTPVYSIWAKSDSAIRQITDENQINIIKAIAVINIINDDILRPISTHIRATLMMNDSPFNQAIRALMKMKILMQRNSSEFVLLTPNGIDVQNNITNYVKSKLPKINRCEVLESAIDLGYIMPREYNDKYSMLRYFKKVFMEAKTFLEIDSSQIQLKYPYDGLIIHIVHDEPAIADKVISKVRTFENHTNIILCLSKKIFSYDELLKKLVATRQLKKSQDVISDSHYLAEVELFEEDILKSVKHVVDELYSPNSENSYFVNCNGEMEGIARQLQLNQNVSKICMQCYGDTPIINNEMVNKNILKPPIRKARNEVVEWILSHSEDNEIPPIVGNGADASIYKAVFSRTGLNKFDSELDHGIECVLQVIIGFISTAEQRRRNFDDLYRTLTSAPYGLRRGCIPLLIAHSLRQFKEYIVFYYSGREVELTSNLLDSLNDDPSKYQLLLEMGTRERETYLNKLECLFSSYTDARTQSINRIHRIVKSMQNWMRSLPEFTKKCSMMYSNGNFVEVPSSIKIIRKELLRFDINSRQLLLETFINELSSDGQITQCYEMISECKTALDIHLNNFKEELSKQIINIFVPNYQGKLSQAIKKWHKDLPATTITHLFDSQTNRLLSFASKLSSYDDEQALMGLTYEFTSMAIEDWSDTLAIQFIENFREAINKINNYQEEYIEGTDNECKVLIEYSDRTIEKSFSNIEISLLGKTILSNLEAVFDEYNNSIEPDEQVAILIKLMKDLLD